jgi:hypothetical protein
VKQLFQIIFNIKFTSHHIILYFKIIASFKLNHTLDKKIDVHPIEMTIVASLQLNLDVTVDSDCDAENFIN